MIFVVFSDFDMVSAQDYLCLFWHFQILLFLKGFTEEERRKLAIITGIIMANGLASAKVLNPIFEEHLVKEGECLCWNKI